MPKNKQPKFTMEDWDKLTVREKFADWFYLRSGKLITTPEGEAAYKAFIKGDLIIIRY